VKPTDIHSVPQAAERIASKRTHHAAIDASKPSAFRGSGPSLGADNGTERTRAIIGRERALMAAPDGPVQGRSALDGMEPKALIDAVSSGGPSMRL
jgi:hypothetical protein